MKTIAARRLHRIALPLLLGCTGLTISAASLTPFPILDRFETFGAESGIPAEKVHAVMKTSDGDLWIGTWNGLCRRENDGRFRRYGPEHGLSHKLVTAIVEDPSSGDLWVATMRGLNRFSADKFTVYTQTDSGLPNNVVYSVAVREGTIWAATAAGTGAFNPKTGAWKIYDHNNTVMHEPWCYSVVTTPDSVFIGAWGGGIIEHDPKTLTFKEYRDPDRDFHYDLVPDDGPINDITSWLAWQEGVLWQCTYFGLARYDGKRWKTWVQDKSPLPSNFTQYAFIHRGIAWIGLDQGVSATDSATWVNYLVDGEGQGQIQIHRPGQAVETRRTDTALSNQFVLGIFVDDQEAWFATSYGLTRGIFARESQTSSLSSTHP